MATAAMFALAVCAAGVIFTVLDAVLLRPLPYRNSERLTYVQLTTREARGTTLYGQVVPFELWQRWHLDATAFAAMAVHAADSPLLVTDRDTRFVETVVVSSNMFALLGVQPALGRDFVSSEDRDGAAPVAILSDAFWRHDLDGTPDVLARHLSLAGKNYRIVGVMPPGVHVPFSTAAGDRVAHEVWVPLGSPTSTSAIEQVNVLGRLTPGETASQAESQLDRITAIQSVAEAGASAATESGARYAQVAPVRRAMSGQVLAPLILVFLASACLFTLVCVNAASLKLTHIIGRQRELAVRLALGASAAQVMRLLMLECLVPIAIGAGIGAYAAVFFTPVAVAAFAAQLPAVGEIRLTWDSALLLSLVAVAAGMLASGLPVIPIISRIQPAGRWDGQGAGVVRTRRRANRVLLTIQVTLAVTLFGATNLFTRTLVQLTASYRGYDLDAVATASVSLPVARYASSELQTAAAQDILDHLQVATGQSAQLALAKGGPMLANYMTTASAPDTMGAPVSVRTSVWRVSPGYFKVLGMSVLAGQLPEMRDGPNALTIDMAAQRALFGRRSAVGQRLTLTKEHFDGVVFAVVNNIDDFAVDTRINKNLRVTRPHVYAPFASAGGRVFTIVARSRTPRIIAPLVRSAVADIDRSAVVGEIATYSEKLASRYTREAALAQVGIVLTLVALIVAAIGLYAVINHLSQARSREYGIRMAIGARRADVMRETLLSGVALVLPGIGAGIVLAYFAGQLARGVLFEVSPGDPLSIGVAALIFLIISVAAVFAPARRATLTDPMVVFRGE